MVDTPRLFRAVVQVSDLEKAAGFYSKLLGAKGRRIHGARHYFDCGPVILAVLDPTQGRSKAKPNPDYLYFSVMDIKKVHARARRLGCLSKEMVHGESGGGLVYQNDADLVQAFVQQRKILLLIETGNDDADGAHHACASKRTGKSDANISARGARVDARFISDGPAPVHEFAVSSAPKVSDCGSRG
jgi:predicted enzyme related to lactoylglutathione lyase